MNLEGRTRKFLEELAALGGPPLQKRPVPDARKFLRDAQARPVALAPADIERRTIAVGPTGETRLVLVRPGNRAEVLPAVVYLHGGGWILGDWQTHERLVRELAASIPALVVFVDYEPSPEQRFPVGVMQAYEAARWIGEHAEELHIDPARLAVCGDSAGGQMAAAVTLLAKERGGPSLAGQVLFYPVTDANLDTASYQEFANQLNLTRDAMAWFWDAYVPDEADRLNPLAAPLQASLEQLRGLPPALVITGENDVLRDEGEAYARKLAEAGVAVTAVRYLGTVHDFVMLNALAETPAAMGATAQAANWLKRTFDRVSRPGTITMLEEEQAGLNLGR
ncbi:MAG: alpha/beta hydrolase fold-3 domain protein [Cyanobacteria bacterium RYN_339]|nr:alpha/beta hydrolase fold-3 domain protein [Cyanobacteria bacterium RYN_339]